MATQIKHSLVLGMPDKPLLVDLKIAAIKTSWPTPDTTETHYVVESTNPPLIAMTPELRGAIIYAHGSLAHEAAEFPDSTGEQEFFLGILDELLARLDGLERGSDAD